MNCFQVVFSIVLSLTLAHEAVIVATIFSLDFLFKKHDHAVRLSHDLAIYHGIAIILTMLLCLSRRYVDNQDQ